MSSVVNLGDQPLANSFMEMQAKQKTFPLELMFCTNCTHLQLSHCVDREEIFKDYIYVSGTSETLKQDFKNFAKFITEKHGVGKILDIACNDGSQLDAFKELGWSTWGIDPAENLYEISSKNHKVICDFLKPQHTDLGKFDVVLAQNVLAHTDTPQKFLQIASKLSSNIYIQTSQADMIFDGQFDTIYHEHISFFSQESMLNLAKKSGLNIASVTKRDIHGVSFLFHLVPVESNFEPTELITQEVVSNFKTKVHETLNFIRSNINSAREANIPVIGYGAAAKGMTVLNAVGIPIDFIIDDSPLKQNKLSPGLCIKVVSISALQKMSQDSNILLIPLAWNFADEISERVRNAYLGNVKILKYFPKMEII